MCISDTMRILYNTSNFFFFFSMNFHLETKICPAV